jgi:leukotriene-A4 hydrolase
MKALLMLMALTNATPALHGQHDQAAKTTTAMRDPNSFANFNQVKIKHLDLTLDVNFDKKILDGSVLLTLDWTDPTARSLVLDTRALKIKSVSAWTGKGASMPMPFKFAETHKIYGDKLTIDVTAPHQFVRIEYQTSPDATGLQWLSAEQTLDKKTPFLFSQSQAIHARSWIPLQDTPAVRFSYNAAITTPKGLLARMSANNDANDRADGDYSFSMPQPIPSYLLALAVGDLQFRSLGDRSGVYAEPGRIEAAAKELVDTENMIKIAENLFGPYRWDRYDMLVLPPSFPFGGMENPRLTFLTPTFIAGDRSLVSLIAHELAHSWSGNLVTNANWESTWLNEGFTTYVQSRIVEAAFGVERERMETALSETDLFAEMKDLAPADQHLRINLTDRDPDDGLSAVAYDKGHWLLRTLEQRFGRKKFDVFLRSWFDQHAFQSVDTDVFLAFLDHELLRPNPGKMSLKEVLQWVDQPGVPKNAKRAVAKNFAAIDKLIAKLNGGKVKAADIGKLTAPAKKYTTQEWLRLLNGLDTKPQSKATLDALDTAHGLATVGNSEVAFVWLLLQIHNGHIKGNQLENFLMSVGRRKFIVPLYTALKEKDAARAKTIYTKARAGYHPIAQSSLDALLR